MTTKSIQVNGFAITVHISAEDARRLVNRTIVPKLGTGLGAREPVLMLQDGQVVWRVPVFLSLPRLGDLGEVGFIEVDTRTGEIKSDETSRESIIQHAQRLYAGATTLSPE